MYATPWSSYENFSMARISYNLSTSSFTMRWIVTWISYDSETCVLPVNDESITARSAAESYQWVLWRQRCEQSTAECQKALTGRGAAGNSCRTWSITVASGLLWLRLVLIASGQPQETHTVIFAASWCLRPWSQHTWDLPKVGKSLHKNTSSE